VTNSVFPTDPPRLTQPVAGKSAWRRSDLHPDDYRVDLSFACLEEIRRAVDEIRAYPLPTILRQPDDFVMPHCRQAMKRARQILKTGVRFALIQYLPLAEMSEDESKTIYWLLSAMVARPVAQKLDGRMIYDVHDTGQQALPGSGVRPDQTNIELKIHNDNAYNAVPPEYVGLLCLQPAKSGGHSRVVSFHTAHNELLARHPNVLPRLYLPFLFDRQKEFHPGDEATLAAPVFEMADTETSYELRSRFSAHQIRGGYAMTGQPVDEEGAAALAAMLDVLDDDRFAADFDLEAGQIQIVDNRALGHSRTAFEDYPEPERRRHLVRLWLRDHGRRAYPG
jgi:alpha-ketoglutarate-dependent taurine dioxygenase